MKDEHKSILVIIISGIFTIYGIQGFNPIGYESIVFFIGLGFLISEIGNLYINSRGVAK